jgi:hypothetical protein
MNSGAAQAAYPVLSVLSVLCAAVCGRMLIVAEREKLISQAWLAAICFALWSSLAALYFWGGVSEDVGYDVHQDRVEPRPLTGSVQEGAELRSWWRGVFGG